MKERIIKIKLRRYKGGIDGVHWIVESITNAIFIPAFGNPITRLVPGMYCSDRDAQAWVDAFRTYEVTCIN